MDKIDGHLRRSFTERTPLTTDIAKLIDRISRRRRVSINDLAKECGSDHSYISRIRSGFRTPTREWIARFAADCSLTEKEEVDLYELFGLIPPGYRIVPVKAA